MNPLAAGVFFVVHPSSFVDACFCVARARGRPCLWRNSSVSWSPGHAATHHLSSHLKHATGHRAELTTARTLPKSRGHILRFTPETSCYFSYLKTRTTDFKVESPPKGLAKKTKNKKKSPSKHFASTFATLWVNPPESRPWFDLDCEPRRKSMSHKVASSIRQSELYFYFCHLLITDRTFVPLVFFSFENFFFFFVYLKGSQCQFFFFHTKGRESPAVTV